MNNKISDPLLFFIKKYNIDLISVNNFILGKKYAAVISEKGNIGLAANLFNVKEFDVRNTKSFDTENYTHRLFLLAYFNSIINYQKQAYLNDDIFNLVDFKSYPEIVMIGYSKPMVKKLNNLRINPVIFDKSSDNEIVTPQRKLPEYLKSANSLILTGTSIINNTFSDIIEQVSENCDVYLIGPSVPLTTDLFEISQIKGIFGTVFNKNDKNVIDVILRNEGTNCLKKYGTKVGLLRS